MILEKKDQSRDSCLVAGYGIWQLCSWLDSIPNQSLRLNLLLLALPWVVWGVDPPSVLSVCLLYSTLFLLDCYFYFYSTLIYSPLPTLIKPKQPTTLLLDNLTRLFISNWSVVVSSTMALGAAVDLPSRLEAVEKMMAEWEDDQVESLLIKIIDLEDWEWLVVWLVEWESSTCR